MEKDIYQLEVERLQAIHDEQFKEVIFKAWTNFEDHSPLFDTIGNKNDFSHGCLTQIRTGYRVGVFAAPNGIINYELTREIVADERIPKSPMTITKESLPVFAEWQRKIKLLEKALYYTFI